MNDPATTQIYTLSLHDALPISSRPATVGEALTAYATDLKTRGADSYNGERVRAHLSPALADKPVGLLAARDLDRKSTRLNSSHEWISYAVFCLKKKKKKIDNMI